jgi:hypothetical protein
MRAKLQGIKQELRRHLHEPVGVVGAWLKRKPVKRSLPGFPDERQIYLAM